MVAWFNKFFEDPAQQTPYNSREGGYQWIWGGPYDALEQIGDEFGDRYSQNLLERAAKEVQKDGIYDWAPSDLHQDMAGRDDAEDQISQPDFGNAKEIDIRNAILLELDEIAAALPKLERPNYSLGGNNPPPEARFWEAEFEEIESQIRTIGSAEHDMRQLLAEQAPDVQKVSEEVRRLQRAGDFLKEKLDKGIDAFITAFGKTMGITVAGSVSTLLGALALKIPVIQGLVASWLTALGLA